MSTLDFSHLTVAERLELIGEIWDSIDGDSPSFAPDRPDFSASSRFSGDEDFVRSPS